MCTRTFIYIRGLRRLYEFCVGMCIFIQILYNKPIFVVYSQELGVMIKHLPTRIIYHNHLKFRAPADDFP